MTGIIDRLLCYLTIKENESGDSGDGNAGVREWIWPRVLSLAPNSPPCDDEDEDEEEEDDDNCGSGGKEETKEIPATFVIQIEEEEDEEEEDRCSTHDKKCCVLTPEMSHKLKCMYHSAKFGLKEGALTGIFLGGAWGIYKYTKSEDKGGDDEGGESSGDGGSTVNENIIFVTAANAAIAMGVFCTFFCCTKAALCCN